MMTDDKRVTRSQTAEMETKTTGTREEASTLQQVSEVVKQQLSEHALQLHESYGKRMDNIESILRDLGELVASSRQDRNPVVAVDTATTRVLQDGGENHQPAPKGDAVGRKPQDFDGSASLAAYRAQFELIAASNGWSTHRKAVELAASLKGPALEVLACVPPNHLENYEALTNVLEQRFGSAHQEHLNRARLRNRTRGGNEGLQELALDVDRLAHLAYPGAPPDFRATVACDQFIDALEDTDMQMTVRQAKPSSLRDALAAALEYESLRRSLKSSHSRQSSGFGNRQASVETQSPSNLETKLDAILSRIQQLEAANRKPAGRLDNRRQVGLGPCWNCNKMGHIRRDCRQPSRMSTSGSSSGQGNE
ncbi:uncharacterized protein LOC122381001 [Amphibalanus amphitrite]|uniref:uncharacterized protein LOC122381001 n=1 Tax=Amphibalanus amphitrite TaxID=1232801 RepID=UPI001C90791D|nr:uncharacterized protein LOC122381001 [Amphibalanus amphitrite]